MTTTRVPVRLTPAMQRRRAAYHEAGHVVGALVEGVDDVSAALNLGNERGLGDEVAGRAIIAWPGLRLVARARVQMAGPEAERFAATLRIIPLNAAFAETWQTHAKPLRDAGADPRRAARQAIGILSHEWFAVEAIAEALYTQGALDARDIMNLFVRNGRGGAHRHLNIPNNS